MENMANTSSRAFRLLSLLQNHRFWPGAELAERLGVSARTLRRDVDRLRELGYPVTAHPGVDGGYQLAAGAALPPLVVDDEEAVALAVGLRLATQGAPRRGRPATGPDDRATDGTVAEAAARALAKVTQVMPARLRRRAEAVAAMTESASWDAARAGQAAAINPDVLASAALACRDAERIRFDYGAASGERTRAARRAAPAGRARPPLVPGRLRPDQERLAQLPAGPGARGAAADRRPVPPAGAARRRRRRVRPQEHHRRAGPRVQVEAVIEAPAAASGSASAAGPRSRRRARTAAWSR